MLIPGYGPPVSWLTEREPPNPLMPGWISLPRRFPVSSLRCSRSPGFPNVSYRVERCFSGASEKDEPRTSTLTGSCGSLKSSHRRGPAPTKVAKRSGESSLR